MRFASDGPDIPDDLLYARDEGDVIFFCGAGVSIAEAGGPSFKELAERVVQHLGSARNSPARQLLALSEKIVAPPGVGGMPPADRIFALLEQEFAIRDVRASVARAVRPRPDPGLGPHRSLLALSQAPDETIRLVTTNFDRVFELVQPGLELVVPPTLPDPRRPGAWQGALHLHGLVKPDYSGAEGSEFVLSSADFGRAYLSDGWATTFMRALTERYHIVFIGYSADDPPIQYLLEALSRSSTQERLYSFHAGGAEQAAALWRHKGVTAIPFTSFDSLWQSIALWAERARDPDQWRASVVASAQRGPRELEPHTRGQVAHLVSSEIGAREFTQATPPPTAEWLCVFDPSLRYDRPRSTRLFAEKMEEVASFENYCLDGDILAKPQQNRSTSNVPQGAWSIFDTQPHERLGSTVFQTGNLLGPRASTTGLSGRLEAIALWFGRVAHEPVTAWWAAGQQILHPVLIQIIAGNIKITMSADVRVAWRLILSSRGPRDINDVSMYHFASIIQQEGWSAWALRELVRLERPEIVVQRAYTAVPLSDEASRAQIIILDVEYPGHLPDIVVPDDFLPDYIREVRHQLEAAELLEKEARGFFLPMLQPIVPYEDVGSHFGSRPDGLPAKVIHFAQMVKRLVRLSQDAARKEIGAWLALDSKIFKLLRVWAAGQSELTSARDASELFRIMDSESFWDAYMQRDLLIAIKARWRDFEPDTKKAIESRLLEGPSAWEGVEPERFERHRAYYILNRIFWLRREQLDTKHDLELSCFELKQVLPEWSERDAEDELDRSMSRGGWVQTVTEHDGLINLPLNELLTATDAASGRRRDILIEHRPFRGLAGTRPVRALAALRIAAKQGDEQASNWSDFLWREIREGDSPKLKVFIARRLTTLPRKVLAANLRTFADWLMRTGAAVHSACPPTYSRLWRRLAVNSTRYSEAAKSAITSDDRSDWMTAAINAPCGYLAQLLCDEFSWEDPSRREMKSEWKRRAALLLRARGDPLSHVMAIFGSRLNWLYYVDEDWTNRHVISIVENDRSSDPSRAAFYAMIHHGQHWALPLFLRLRNFLIESATTSNGGERSSHNLAAFLFSGWISKDENEIRLVSDVDMREVLISTGNDVRASIVRQLEGWAAENSNWNEACYFLENVWPKQLVAKTSAVAAALASLAISSGEYIPDLTRAVLPHLSPAADDWTNAVHLRGANDGQLERFPEEYLTLLHAVLSIDSRYWPYGTEAFILRLGEVEILRTDPRLAELKRRMKRHRIM